MNRNVSTLFNLREKEIKENLAQVENGIFSNTSDRIFYNVFFYTTYLLWANLVSCFRLSNAQIFVL